MTEAQFKAVDSKEIRLLTLKERYQKLNGKFKTTVAILLVILAGGAYAFYKNEVERARALANLKEANRVADSVYMVRTDSLMRTLISEMIRPLAVRQDSLVQSMREIWGSYGLPIQPLRLDTAKIYEQLQPPEAKR